MDRRKVCEQLKRALALLLMMVLLTPVFAAGDSICIGQCPDGREIMAEKHFFGKRIECFEPVPDRAQLCISFVEKIPPLNQELGLYDVMKHRLLWVAEIDFSKDNYVINSQGILVAFNNTTRQISYDGNVLWEKKMWPVYADEESGTLLSFQKPSSKTLLGIGLRDGSTKWQGEMRHRYGCDLFHKLENGKLVVAAENLYLLDPLTGNIKSIVANMGIGQPGLKNGTFWGAFLGGLAGALVGSAITGFSVRYVPVFQPGGPSFFHGLHSNLCIDDDRFYFADRKKLWCLNENFDILWERDLKKKSSMSLLKVEDKTLHFSNLGIGLDTKNHEFRDTKPYTAAFDKESGEEINLPEETEPDKVSLSLCFLKNMDEDSFTPLWLTYEQIEEQDPKRLFAIDKQLSSSLLSIHHGNDYWIVDEKGTARLHLNQAILQTALFGHCFVGLNMNNVLFQFDIDDL